MVAAGAIVAGATYVVGGITSVVSKSQKAQQTRSDLDREIESLKQDKAFLEASYNQSKLTLNNQAERAIGNLNWNIGYNLDAQGRSSNINALTGVNKQEQMYSDLTEMLAQASQKEGAARQSSALTGFRDSGSNQNAQRNAERENKASIESAKRTINLTSAQMFSEASASYWDYSKKVESYQNSINDTRAELAEQLESIRLQYENNRRKINENIDNAYITKDRAKYDGWDIFLDLLSAGAAAGVAGYQEYENQKLRYDTETSYAGITSQLREQPV